MRKRRNYSSFMTNSFDCQLNMSSFGIVALEQMLDSLTTVSVMNKQTSIDTTNLLIIVGLQITAAGFKEIALLFKMACL
jgi:hypothetical protein